MELFQSFPHGDCDDGLYRLAGASCELFDQSKGSGLWICKAMTIS
jgi:hypothetical protein